MATIIDYLVLAHSTPRIAEKYFARAKSSLKSEPDVTIKTRWIPSLEALRTALAEPSRITVLIGHGGWYGDSGEWRLGIGRSNTRSRYSVQSVLDSVSLGSRLLVVDACDNHGEPEHENNAFASWSRALSRTRTAGLITCEGDMRSQLYPALKHLVEIKAHRPKSDLGQLADRWPTNGGAMHAAYRTFIP